MSRKKEYSVITPVGIMKIKATSGIAAHRLAIEKYLKGEKGKEV